MITRLKHVQCCKIYGFGMYSMRVIFIPIMALYIQILNFIHLVKAKKTGSNSAPISNNFGCAISNDK